MVGGSGGAAAAAAYVATQVDKNATQMYQTGDIFSTTVLVLAVITGMIAIGLYIYLVSPTDDLPL